MFLIAKWGTIEGGVICTKANSRTFFLSHKPLELEYCIIKMYNFFDVLEAIPEVVTSLTILLREGYYRIYTSPSRTGPRTTADG